MLASYLKFRDTYLLKRISPFPLLLQTNGFDLDRYKGRYITRHEDETKRYEHTLKYHYTCAIHKWDKVGRPVYLDRAGMLDGKKLVQSLTAIDSIKLHLCVQETLVACCVESSRIHKQHVHEIIVIEVQLYHICKEMFNIEHVLIMCVCHYPLY
jgi:hypothetical protein